MCSLHFLPGISKPSSAFVTLILHHLKHLKYRTLFFLFALPVKFSVLNKLHKFILLLEVHGQVCRKDRVLHNFHYAPVVLCR